MSDIYIIGTLHDFQIDDGKRDREVIELFMSVLKRTCYKYGIKAMAEELNLEALGKFSQRGSTCKIVADELDLVHVYCDPNSELRSKLGIFEDTIIKTHGFIDDLSEEEVNKKIRAENEKRELIWINKIRELDIFPLLFICGAKHAIPFSQLLHNHGLESIVVNHKWLPNDDGEDSGWCRVSILQ